VGLAEGFQGVVRVAAAIPAGYYADSKSRQATLRTGMIAAIISIALFHLALIISAMEDVEGNLVGTCESSGTSEFILLCIALCVNGIYDGITSGPLEAIYHDSINRKERADMATVKYVTMILFRMFGPMISAGILISLGNTWTRPSLRATFFAGVALSLIPVSFLAKFDDKKTLGSASEAFQPLKKVDEHGLSKDAKLADKYMLMDNAKYIIPRVVLSSDILFGLANGMTIKFFPLFFKNECGMSPASVSFVYVCSPVVVAFFALVANSISKSIGRIRVVLLFSISSSSILFYMWYDQDAWQVHYLILPLYLLRNAFFNSLTPIKKSILVDFVDKKARGRWNSLDSVTKMCWSGSAILGGYICDRHGFGATFLITCVVQLLATSLFATLLVFEKNIR